MNSQQLINFQEQGFCRERQQAQQAIYVARSKTPEQYHNLFYSTIRFVHDGYEWFWVLK